MKEGTTHFVHQRVSAILLAVLGGWFAVSLLQIDSMTYLDVTRFVARPINAVLVSVLGLTLGYHSYLGVEVVIDDYVHSRGLNRTAMMLSRLAHIGVVVAMLYSVWRIGADL